MKIDGSKNNQISSEGLSRSLSSRQMQMLAIGGVIGVGLFYGSAMSIKVAGPGVLITYILCGFLAAIVMRALGEMTIEKPVSGSFSTYASENLGPSIGFITSGMWWFFWVATVMSELAAIGKLVQYWVPDFPVWIPGLIALVLFTLSNLLMVKIFGELEYWFAVLKVLAISVFIIFGALIIFTGLFNNGDAVYFTNLWSNGGFMPNGWFGVISATSLVVQIFSGIETLAVQAGESDNPSKNIRKAFKTVTSRISILYIGSTLVMLCVFPWNYLLENGGSPYVLMFAKIGIPVAAGLVNLIIILSALSSCNTGVYGASRMLFSSAKRGKLTKLNKNNVPHVAIFATAAMISLGVIVTYIAPDNVYVWITSASAFASLWTWGVILMSELVSRKKNNKLKKQLQYPMPLWPTLPIIGLTLVVLAVIGIAVSPLTRLSFFSGVAWLAILIVYYNVSIRSKKENVFIETTKKSA